MTDRLAVTLNGLDFRVVDAGTKITDAYHRRQHEVTEAGCVIDMHRGIIWMTPAMAADMRDAIPGLEI